jgi:hypothetical protein
LVDTVFEKSVGNVSLIETYNFLISHAIRLDQKNKKKAAKEIYSYGQSSVRVKKDKVKKVLAIFNKIQIQNPGSLDDKSVTAPTTKTIMERKLAHIPSEIWMNLLRS